MAKRAALIAASVAAPQAALFAMTNPHGYIGVAPLLPGLSGALLVTAAITAATLRGGVVPMIAAFVSAVAVMACLPLVVFRYTLAENAVMTAFCAATLCWFATTADRLAKGGSSR